MLKDRRVPQEVPSWSRLLEWSLVAGVIAVLCLVFFRQVNVLQGQIELAAVRTTLGALRTALLLDYLHQKVKGDSQAMAGVQRNPFELLEHKPVNYKGVLRPDEVEAVPAGSWLFEPSCDCVGYVPLYSQWFVSPSGDVMAWYRVSGEQEALQLIAKDAYRWQDEVMN